MAKLKAVTEPIPMVAIMAFGTVRVGVLHSSARCKVASRPISINEGVDRPIKKQTPSGHLLEVFRKSVQIEEVSRWSVAREGQVIATTRNSESDR